MPINSEPLKTSPQHTVYRQTQAMASGPAGIDPKGGDFQAGFIPGISLCTVGEAIGHYAWCDPVFIDQIAKEGAKYGAGVKSRFTHPTMCSDGLGNYLGRLKNFRKSDDGQQALADLHLHPAAWDAPNGALAPYVLELAATDAKALATSIVFDLDDEAMRKFRAENQAATVDVIDGKEVTRSRFKSPDPNNTNNYDHVRLAKLWAGDLVDDPAANPGGLFAGHDPAAEATALVDFALGLSQNLPTLQTFDAVHPERIRQFVTNYLASHGLALTPTAAPPVDPRADLTAQLERYVAKFGAIKAAAYLLSEKYDWPAALEAHAAELADQLATNAKIYATQLDQDAAAHAKQLTEALAKIDDLEKRLAACNLGQPKPLSQRDPDTQPRPARFETLTPGQRQFVRHSSPPATSSN